MRVPNPFRFLFRRGPASGDASRRPAPPRPPVLTLQERRLLLGLLLLFGLGLAARAYQLRTVREARTPVETSATSTATPNPGVIP